MSCFTFSFPPPPCSALLYLAAAVADFYIPSESMPEHKLQSAEGAPEVKLSLVPKMLSPLVSAWVPRAYVVSFKLETEDKLLVRGRLTHLKRPNIFFLKKSDGEI